jgi:hypothetical protein
LTNITNIPSCPKSKVLELLDDFLLLLFLLEPWILTGLTSRDDGAKTNINAHNFSLIGIEEMPKE